MPPKGLHFGRIPFAHFNNYKQMDIISLERDKIKKSVVKLFRPFIRLSVQKKGYLLKA